MQATPPFLGEEEEGEDPVPASGGRLTAKELAARSIQPGCAHWTKKEWPNVDPKPGLGEMKAEVQRRDPNRGTAKAARPKYWNWQELADFLHKTPLPGGVGGAGASPAAGQPPGAGQPEHPEAPGGDDSSPDEGPGRRWTQRVHTIRLGHVVKSDPAGFIKRDAKPETRNAMEAGAKNSYWQDAARRFNDPTFKPKLMVSKDPEMNEVFKKLKDPRVHQAGRGRADPAGQVPGSHPPAHHQGHAKLHLVRPGAVPRRSRRASPAREVLQ